MIALLIAIIILLAAFYHLLLGNRDPPKLLTATSKKPTLLQTLLAEAFEYASPNADPSKRVLVLYATEYGFAREVAQKLAARLAEAHLVPRLVSTLHYRVLDLTKEPFIALVCSTTGDGVPPNEAADFRDALVARDVVMPPTSRFAVLALGDRSYPHFCRAGAIFDDLFGHNRILHRVDVDQEDWPVIDDWAAAFQKAIEGCMGEIVPDEDDYLEPAMAKYAEAMENQEARYTYNEPFMATLVKQELLTAPKTGAPDEKEVIRVEFDISQSGIHYNVGDAVGVVPMNSTEHVTRLLLGMASDGGEKVRVTEKGELVEFEKALAEKLDIRLVRPELVHKLAQRAQDQSELELAANILGFDATDPMLCEQNANNATEWGKQYLVDHEVIDVLGDFVTARLTAQELTDLLRPLHARYYSISSTSVVTPNTIAATVDVLRYETRSLAREGVASTFLKDRCKVNESKVGLFISKNNNFRLPVDGSKAIVMIGPGTGVAPFIGFIEERLHKGASGENWLFFGCRHERQDFLYGDILREHGKHGRVVLETAFSRDTEEKVYVQHRMEERAAELWGLLQDEAHVYVCGDGGKMAEDVDEALKRIVREQGRMNEVEAKAFVEKLAADKRYQRDVWVT